MGESLSVSNGTKNKMVAGLLAIFLGGLGIHKFYLVNGGVKFGRNS